MANGTDWGALPSTTVPIGAPIEGKQKNKIY